MSIAEEMVTSSSYYSVDTIIANAMSSIPIEERFPGARVLTFEDGSQLLIKKNSSCHYLTVICDLESLK